MFANMGGRKHLRVYLVDEELNKQLKNICKNNDKTKTNYLRPLITEMVNAYPEHLKKTPPETQPRIEIAITDVNERIIEQLTNVAQNLGVSVSYLIREKIKETIENAPSWALADSSY